ncbi:hypothetical protein R1sor_007826 [Riccia sorocarpa]|uniref:Late embryogenesis abundant protein n=1 Tax=Riccia sorocarpa TaxID=122646 RepID=A0ABD3HVR0_9MARC
MQAVMADVKETVQNAAAKAEQKLGSAEASATEKTEKLMANDEAQKEEAQARKHEKEAEAYRLKEEQEAQNHDEKVQSKQEAHERAMQNVQTSNVSSTGQGNHQLGLPIDGNPYVEPPVATVPESEENRDGEGYPVDQPHKRVKTNFPSDQSDQSDQTQGSYPTPQPPTSADPVEHSYERAK